MAQILFNFLSPIRSIAIYIDSIVFGLIDDCFRIIMGFANSEFYKLDIVDDIRKKSLKGMAQLADNPDDERYQLLKKIWQICDKKPEQQTAFGSHQPIQPQKPM